MPSVSPSSDAVRDAHPPETAQSLRAQAPKAPLLDHPTLTGSEGPYTGLPRGWHVTEYQEAGEISFLWRAGGEVSRHSKKPGVPESPVALDEAGRRERSAAESARRARSKLRRYCVGNGLDHLWTLTYAPEFLPDDEDGVWSDIERFRKRLHEGLGRLIPVAAVIERGTEGGRLHVHLLVPGRIPIEVMRKAWGRGFVQVEAPPVRRGMSKRERLRVTARYLTKYVGKEFDEGRPNRKRYSVTTGFQPVRRWTFGGHDLLPAIEQALNGRRIVHWWQSDDDWPGPPVVCVRLE